jgi:hypothetical protein
MTGRMHPRVRPQCPFCRDPWSFEKPIKNPLHCFSVSLTSAQRPLPSLFLYNPRSPTVDGGAVAPASQDRPENVMTRIPLWLTPNSTPYVPFPSINYKVLAPNFSVHGDSAINGQTEAFPVILRVLAQLIGSRSIKSTQEC